MAKFDYTIDWHGPFKLDDAVDICRNRGWEKGVYIAIGHHRPIRVRLSAPKIQYIGQSNELYYRVSPLHHDKLCRLSIPISEVWIGRFENDKDRKKDLKEVEKGLIFFLRGRMNIDHRKDLPITNISIKNRFYNGRTNRRRWVSPHRNWPRAIRYDFSKKRAVVWRGLRRLTFTEKMLESFKLRKPTKLEDFIRLPALKKAVIAKYFSPKMNYKDFVDKQQNGMTNIWSSDKKGNSGDWVKPVRQKI